ncbi:MAG: prenyltransferase [bacterium]
MFELLKNWKEIIDTTNLSPGRKMDFVSKWLLATRASVFSMTITSVLIGTLLAFIQGVTDVKRAVLNAVLTAFALVLAHASNNLINDYFDYKQGVDTPDYPRTQYSPHPLASGLMSEKKLLMVFFFFGIIELSIAAYFYKTVGIWAMVFAIAGFLLSVFYVAPPFKLKYNGLGELAIFIIWGPLITVGTYYVINGNMPAKIWFASIPYGLVVMNVLLGKHIDKYEKDKEKGVKTLPVVLGLKNAIIFTKINTGLFFISIIICVFFKVLQPLTLLVFLAWGRFMTFINIMSKPKPETPPENFPVWPLWYVVWAFWFNKRAGELFVLGLILSLIPWFKF